MTTPASGDQPLHKGSSYFTSLPPDMSELRVVLLGNSWSEKKDVANLLLGENVFSSQPKCCERISGTLEEKKIVIINTPYLPPLNTTQHELTEFIKDCDKSSAPGPHVFLLILQPENFTEEQSQRLCRVLELYSDRSFNHSLILISASKEESSGSVEVKNPALSELIKKCGCRYLKRSNTELPELFSLFSQIVKDNNGEHVSYEPFEDTTPTLPGDHQSPKQKETKTPITEAVKAAGLHKSVTPPPAEKNTLSDMSAFRIVLLGKSEDKKTRLGNLIIKYQGFHCQKQSPTPHCVATCGEWRGKTLTVVKTPDMLSLSVETMRREVKSCVSLCHPGPNVLLLLVKPSNFTGQDRKTLKSILSLFGGDSFKRSMVILTHEQEMSVSANELIRDCEGRHYNMCEGNYQLLMEKIQEMTNEHSTNPSLLEPGHIKPSLNLVLCGRRGAEKTSAARAILGQTELHSVSNSSECVKNQGEVCGRWLSLVELPALYGKPQEEVMEELLRCISLCDPEGVHAFILVLPVDSLTDEDKGELETIQNAFGSRVNDFTMILFTVESDPTDPAVLKENGDIQQLCESCGGRSTVLNIKEKQQIPELLEIVESMRGEQTRCFTKDIFITGQMEKVSKLTAELQDVTQRAEVGGDDDSQSRVRKNYSSCYPAKVSDATKEVSQIQVEKLLKEQEEETRRKEKELIELQKKISEQKAQLEEEKNLRNRQLKEKDDLINRERKERERKHEEEERRRKKQEETQRQEWKRKLEDSEKRAEKKLEQSRKEMKKERDAWDKERKELWERIHQEQKQNLEEVKVRNQKLQEEYQWKRKKWICIVSLLFVLFFIILYISK